MGKRAHDFDVKERVDRAEEMLCQGLSASYICKVFMGPPRFINELDGKPADPGQGVPVLNIGGYDISERTARKYLAHVYERWDESSTADAPWRREKNIRMAERLYAKAYAEGHYGAAATTMGVIARMTGSLTQPVNPERQRVMLELRKELEAVNGDPVKLSLHAQRVMAVELSFLLEDRTIDAEKRVKWMLEIVSRIGHLHPKSLAGKRVEDLEGQLQQLAPIDPAQLVDDETEDALQEFAARIRASIDSRPKEAIDVTPAPSIEDE